MELSGIVDQETQKIFGAMFPIWKEIEQKACGLPDSLEKQVAKSLYEDASAINAVIYRLCKDGGIPTSSLAVAALMRTLIENCISVFAFCIDPKNRANLYWDFKAIVDYANVLERERAIGCPHFPDEEGRRVRLQARKQETVNILLERGEAFLREEYKKKGLRAALQRNDRRVFRDHWFPETRKEILEKEQMGWIYGLHYIRFCSAVHADSAGSLTLKDYPRGDVVFHALEFYSAAIFRLIQTLGIHLSEEYHLTLLNLYEGLRLKT